MEEYASLPLGDYQLEDLCNKAKDYALSHGIIMRTMEKPSCPDFVCHAPFCLLPSPFPRRLFKQASGLQTHLNTLMHKVAHDYSFMKETLQKTIEVDDFTRRLWQIYEIINKEDTSQPVSLGLYRSDYMVDSTPGDEENLRLKQVEFNTIASSFAGLSQQLTNLHRYILHQCGIKGFKDKIADNKPVDGLSRGLVLAHRIYDNPSAVILFLVSEVERNIYDQKWLEFGVFDIDPTINIVRATMLDVANYAQLMEDNRLVYKETEVSVVYFRTGYTDPDYAVDPEKTWAARLLIERSRAVKCPSVYQQLAGTKKIQQVLFKPGTVERFIEDKTIASQIRDLFAGQYSLDVDEGDEIVNRALLHPECFVMKPQREGGSNNFYDEELAKVLDKIKSSKEREAYVLMDRINPKATLNYPVRTGEKVELQTMISELGVYGVVIGDAKDIQWNFKTGHNMRTKVTGVNEGGVATGYSVLDTPFLI